MGRLIFYFYKGTTLGITELTPKYFNKYINEKINFMKKQNLNKLGQALVLCRLLDEWEGELRRVCNGRGVTDDDMKKTAEKFDMPSHIFWLEWCSNIIILVLIKELKNDEMNGYLFVEHNCDFRDLNIG